MEAFENFLITFTSLENQRFAKHKSELLLFSFSKLKKYEIKNQTLFG
jgi:hypothetical protein